MRQKTSNLLRWYEGSTNAPCAFGLFRLPRRTIIIVSKSSTKPFLPPSTSMIPTERRAPCGRTSRHSAEASHAIFSKLRTFGFRCALRPLQWAQSELRNAGKQQCTVARTNLGQASADRVRDFGRIHKPLEPPAASTIFEKSISAGRLAWNDPLDFAWPLG